MALTLASDSFTDGGTIPSRYTCDGEDVSPPLKWSGIPEGTRSLLLVVDDPDAPDPAAPKRTWVHWIVYDIPPDLEGLPELARGDRFAGGMKQGVNDWQRTGYGGPCPSIGRHRYMHKLYALDIALGDMGRATKSKIEQAMQGHVLAKAELIGTYERQR